MSYCYLAFRTNVLLNLCCPGHLSYYSPNESEPLGEVNEMTPFKVRPKEMTSFEERPMISHHLKKT